MDDRVLGLGQGEESAGGAGGTGEGGDAEDRNCFKALASSRPMRMSASGGVDIVLFDRESGKKKIPGSGAR